MVLLFCLPSISFAGATNAIGALGGVFEVILWGLLGAAVIIAWLIYSSKKMKEINKKPSDKE